VRNAKTEAASAVRMRIMGAEVVFFYDGENCVCSGANPHGKLGMFEYPERSRTEENSLGRR